MAFRTLFTAGYQAFLDENRDAGEELWFFLHIPKTAGSSFRAEIETILTPDCNINVYDAEMPGHDHHARLRAAVAGFVTAWRQTRYRFASGHVPVTLTDPLHRGPSTPRIFTILRDPVARFVSDFRYQSTTEHADHAAFRARFPSIEAYLDAPGERDKMTRYLEPTRDATIEATIDHVLDTFAFVGSMESYDLSFRIMMDLLGVRRAPSVFTRRTSGAEAIAVDLTPTLEAAIRDANRRDVALYDSFMLRLHRVEDIMQGRPVTLEDDPTTRRAPVSGFSEWRYVA